MKEFHWNQHDSNVWLDPLDAFLCTYLPSSPVNIFEIGVYKGGWCFNMLENLKSCSYVGIDPYPGLESVRQEFLKRSEEIDVKTRIDLFKSLDDFASHNLANKRKFEMIHIDGEHSEFAVARDLKFSSEILTPDGVIVVDDIFKKEFPGIASAVYSFIWTSTFVPFLYSRHKIYLCDVNFHERYLSRAISLVESAQISYSSNFVLGTFGEGYFQSRDVKGFRNIGINSALKTIETSDIKIVIEHPSRKKVRSLVSKIIKATFRIS
jgi:hypothetical protein